jgi:hypothetical protein
MSFVRALTNVDEATLNLVSSAKGLKTAVDYGDKIGAFEHSVEHAKGYVEGTRYAATGVEKGTTLSILAAKYFPISLDSSTIRFLEGITAAQVLASLGVILASFQIIINSISVFRQHEVLSVIPAIVDRNNIKETLENLDQVNFNHFRKALPEHLKKRLEEHGARSALKNLDAIDYETAEVAIKFVNDIRDFARKKQIFHVLGVIAGVVSLVGSIGLLVGFPPVALMILTVAGLALTVAIVVISKGWVENPEGVFNWQLCLPESLRNKLTPPVEKEIPMEELMLAHDGYTPQPTYVSQADPKDAAIMVKFNEPEVPKKQTFFEKFLGFFKRKPQEPIEEELSSLDRFSVSDHVAVQGVLRHSAHGLQQLPNGSPMNAG